MENRNTGLLDEVIENRLERVLQCTAEGDKSFTEAMEAIDRQIELSKIESANKKVIEEVKVKQMEANNAVMKMDVDATIADEDLKIRKRESRRNTTLKILEIVGLVLVVPVVNYALTAAHTRYVCEFEKDFTFTTTPGKALSGIFRSKK